MRKNEILPEHENEICVLIHSMEPTKMFCSTFAIRKYVIKDTSWMTIMYVRHYYGVHYIYLHTDRFLIIFLFDFHLINLWMKFVEFSVYYIHIYILIKSVWFNWCHSFCHARLEASINAMSGRNREEHADNTIKIHSFTLNNNCKCHHISYSIGCHNEEDNRIIADQQS